ncbi:MAG: DMT family transporter [Burkholderiales bacterium]
MMRLLNLIKNPSYQGTAWAAISCFSVTMSLAISKYLVAYINPFSLVMLETCLCLLIMLCVKYYRHEKLFLPNASKKFYVVRAILRYVTLLLWTYLLPILPLNALVTIGFVIPLLVVILARILLKEVVNVKTYAAIILGCLGVVLALQPNFENSKFYLILAFIAAIVAAFSEILTKHQAMKNKLADQLLYSFWYAALLSLPLGVLNFTPLPLSLWPIVGAAGITFFISTLTMFRALRLVPISFIKPIDYSKLVFSAFVGYVAFGEVMTMPMFLGSLLIVSNSVLLIRKAAT